MNTPKLRFKEFIDEWKKIQLDSFVDINPKNDSLPEQFIYIDLESVNNGILTTRKIINKSEAPSRAQRTIKENDILYQTVRPYQMNNLFVKNFDSDYPYIASTGYALLRTKENPYFVYSILYQKSFVNKVLDMCTGTSYPAISANDLGTITVGLPSLKEQEKISKPLELLDKKIELQSKKIEDLKLFKKGLINKELNNLNDCKSISLNELGTTYSGLYGKTKEDFENGNCKFINFMSVLKDNIDVSSLTTVKINPNEKQNKVEKGDLFFMTSSETKEEVALCSTLSYDVKNLYLNSFCFGYRINNLNLINNEYLNCLLHSPKYRKQISNLGQGFTRVNISKNKLLELLVEVPDMKQQIRIVSINNKINYKINSEINKLNKLNELKKGLMQNMFV